jgi:ribosomal protein L21E
MLTMTLQGEGRIIKISKSNTRHISIPSSITQDSNFHFKQGDIVDISVNPEMDVIIIVKRRILA